MWAIIRNNIRLADLVEMDLRSLVAGCHVAAEKFVDVLEAMGADAVRRGHPHDPRPHRGRDAPAHRAADGGTYRSESWAEWDDEFFRIPCRLTGRRWAASSSTSTARHHRRTTSSTRSPTSSRARWSRCSPASSPATCRTTTASSRPSSCAALKARSSTPSHRRRSPPRTWTSPSTPPRSVSQCVRLALAASPDAPARGAGSPGGEPDLRSASTPGREPASTGTPTRSSCSTATGWAAPPARDRDGLPLAGSIVGRESGYSFTDIEILESWYPILVSEKRARPGEHGAGNHRAGRREHDGLPAARHRQAHRSDARHATVAPAASAVAVERPVRAPSSSSTAADGATEADRHPRVRGGARTRRHLRVPLRVRRRIRRSARPRPGRRRVRRRAGPIRRRRRRAHLRRRPRRARRRRRDRHRGMPTGDPARTARASAPRQPSQSPPTRPDRSGQLVTPERRPLYLGVAQRGSLAISERSGAPLAVAPDHWTDGCPVLVETRSDLGPAVHIRSYLDPVSGHALFVEAVPAGAPRSFEIAPTRWLEAR